jgi:hypothetical protein
MQNDEMVLAAIDEIVKRMDSIQLTLNQKKTQSEVNFEPILKTIKETQTSIEYSLYQTIDHIPNLTQIGEAMKKVFPSTAPKEPDLITKYVPINNAKAWFISILSILILLLSISSYLFIDNSKLRSEADIHRANSFKYRYLKLKSDKFSELSGYLSTTTDLVYMTDNKYNANQKFVEETVLKKEEAINRANEAQEIAKQKALEARKADESVKELNKKAAEIKLNN